jgi:biotin carboxylase
MLTRFIRAMAFLAESAYFAEICEACNIKFIGPAADIIPVDG